MFQGKLVTAGPRGNKCRECEEKVKKPAVILKVTGEYNRYSGHPKIDNFCGKCAATKIRETLATLKSMLDTLENGVTDESQLGSKRVRTV